MVLQCTAQWVRTCRQVRASFASRFVVLATVAGLTVGATGCGRHESDTAAATRRVAEVSVVTVAPRDVPVTSEYIAQVQSSRQVNIQARVNGFLEKRVYTEGMIVKEGQVLFLMDQRPFQAQLNAARAALRRQEANLQVTQANLARTKPLTAAHALSQKDLDDATGGVLVAEASVDQAKAAVEEASLRLSYCTITSPVTGASGAAQQQDGAYINEQNSLLTTVAVLSPMWVNFSVSQNELQRLRDEITKGLLRAPERGAYQVEILLIDGSVFPATGQITFADFQFNAQTGMFLVRVTVDNPDDRLRPNEFVRVRLRGSIRPNAILIPQRAVQQGAKGHFVWVVSGEGEAEYRPVEIGDAFDNDTFILEGLRAGDRVVVDGGLTLAPRQAVKAVPLGGKGAAPSGDGTNRSGVASTDKTAANVPPSGK